MILHVVVFKFYDTVADEHRVEAEQLLRRTLKAISVVKDWRVFRQINYTGKVGDWDLLELALFEKLEDLNGEEFRTHPAHVAMTKRFSQIADWVKVDAPADWNDDLPGQRGE